MKDPRTIDYMPSPENYTPDRAAADRAAAQERWKNAPTRPRFNRIYGVIASLFFVGAIGAALGGVIPFIEVPAYMTVGMLALCVGYLQMIAQKQ